MTCPLCEAWDQTEPNCGHGLVDGIQAPSKWFTKNYALAYEIGVLPLWYMAIENTRHGAEAISTLARRAA